MANKSQGATFRNSTSATPTTLDTAHKVAMGEAGSAKDTSANLREPIADLDSIGVANASVTCPAIEDATFRHAPQELRAGADHLLALHGNAGVSLSGQLAGRLKARMSVLADLCRNLKAAVEGSGAVPPALLQEMARFIEVAERTKSMFADDHRSTSTSREARDLVMEVVAYCSVVSGSSPSIDPRLQELTEALLAVRDDGNAETSKAKRLHRTLCGLWPNRSLDAIVADPSTYLEPGVQPRRMSDAAFRQILKIKKVPAVLADTLALVEVPFCGFDGVMRQGQIAVHQDLVASTRRIFEKIAKTGFPMTSVVLMDAFDWSDPDAVRFNNSSGFNPRLVAGSSEVSDHAFGSAIDINPLINPWTKEGHPSRPYDPALSGTLHSKSDVVRIFKEEGWKWGGDWTHSKDWQHFYRPEIPLQYFGKVEEPE